MPSKSIKKSTEIYLNFLGSTQKMSPDGFFWFYPESRLIQLDTIKLSKQLVKQIF